MAKKLVAVTNIKFNGELLPAGEPLDASKFDKKQLEALYDAGAVRVDEGSDEKTETKTTETPETATPQATTSADQSAQASSPAATTSSPKAAAATRESTSGKSAAK